PVSHSLSEKYFTDKFILEGIEARYERFLLKDIHSLPQILSAYPELKGLSVTSPFKESVIDYCDELCETSKEIRAVNTLKISREGGKVNIKGYNTDVDGFAAALIPLIGNNKPDTLILGSGGAARAVAHALNKLGIKFMVVSRSPGMSKIGYAELDESHIKSHQLIINATPLGMKHHTGESPEIPYHLLTSGHILFDLIYNPAETPFLQKGRQHRARIENGMIMLQAQAEKAWKIWTGK
ncbi:MAG: shikimate dehydrogenase, partial [Bacteroidota bacterium]